MRIMFFGIYQYGLSVLQAILEQGFDVAGVVTKPNTKAEIQPVAEFASSQGLTVLQPTTLKTNAFRKTIAGFEPDLLVVSGFHRLLPGPVLNTARRAAINAHASLLPTYRGPTPYKWVIANGETKTGVTTHLMTAEFDMGNILHQQEIGIDDDDTSESLFQKLCPVAAETVIYTLQHFDNGSLTPRSQEESRASYYGYPSEDDRRINWQMDAQQIHNRVRGFYPRPGTWAMFRDRKVQFAPGRVTTQASSLQPGQVVDILPDGVSIATTTVDVILNPIYSDEPSDLLADLKAASHVRFE